MGRKKTTNEFVEQSKSLHGNKYDYSEVVYIEANAPVTILCSEHGPFNQRPNYHVRGGGCPGCSGNRKDTADSFIEKAKSVHGNKYDYSEVVYYNAKTKVIIICPEHGIFKQTPDSHLHNHGCPGCYGGISYTTDIFIENSRKKHKHGIVYDYSQVDYKNDTTEVIILCPEHGPFNQRPHDHTRGHGCPCCIRESEAKILKLLRDNGFKFIHDRTWKEVLGNRRPDFLSHELKLVIELDGEQHFQQVRDWTSPDIQIVTDTCKAIRIMRAGYSIIRIPYCSLNREDLEIALIPHIKRYNKPMYITMNPDSIYFYHKKLYREYKNLDDNQLQNMEVTV
jgi:very-short-patch-repair endonuclease